MKFEFAHLADYAGEDRAGKLVVAGIFDRIFTGPKRPIVLPQFFLVMQFTAHVTEGSEHRVELRFTDADGKDLLPRAKLPMKLVPLGPQMPLRGRVFVQLGSIPVHNLGDYTFSFFVDDHLLGQLPLQVVAQPQVR